MQLGHHREVLAEIVDTVAMVLCAQNVIHEAFLKEFLKFVISSLLFVTSREAVPEDNATTRLF